MALKDRIYSIKSYFSEMQVVDTEDGLVIYVGVHFPTDWTIDNEVTSLYDVTIAKGNVRGQYYFAAPLENGEEDIFDAIDLAVKKMKDAAERNRLLAEKKNELIALFSNKDITLEELKNLQFFDGRVPDITDKAVEENKLEEKETPTKPKDDKKKNG